jgi:hypothetical protein
MSRLEQRAAASFDRVPAPHLGNPGIIIYSELSLLFAVR